jgi:phospholipase/lecithinase/hemolysin
MRSWHALHLHLRLLATVGAFVLLPSWAQAGYRVGIGVIGDSYSDEYQFYPPDRTTAQNWVEILARTRGLNFGEFTAESRGEPRNQGFAFNWARGDAETGDMLRSGQHLGVAAQVARGEVGLVIVFIGANDFIHALASPERDKILDRVLRQAIANLRVAVDRILKAHPRVSVILTTVPDIVDLPEFSVPVRTGALSQTLAESYSAAIRRYNRQMGAMALVEKRIAILDLALAAQLAPRRGPDHVWVEGRKLDRTHPANRPDHAFLADGRHISTMLQAVLANYVINVLNARFDANIAPLTKSEIWNQPRDDTSHFAGRPR